MPIFDISAKAFASVGHFTAKADIRYYLQGICVRPADGGGVYVMASDGHTAGFYFDPTGSTDSAFLIRNTSDFMKHINAPRGDHRRVTCDGDRPIVSDVVGKRNFERYAFPKGDGGIFCEEAERFPNVKKFIGELALLGPLDGMAGGLNPAFLARLQKVHKALGLDKSFGTPWFFRQKKAAVSDSGEKVFALCADPNFVGVIMAMRIPSRSEHPKWITDSFIVPQPIPA